MWDYIYYKGNLVIYHNLDEPGGCYVPEIRQRKKMLHDVYF